MILRQPGICVPTRPSPTAAAGEFALRQFRIEAQRGDRGHQLERRTRRIVAVARAVEHWIGGARGAFDALTIASTSPVCGRHHHSRAVARRQLAPKDFRRRELQPNIDGSPHVPIALEQRLQRRSSRLMPVADQRRELAVVRVALQSRVEIVLDQRSIGGVEIFAGAQIAK